MKPQTTEIVHKGEIVTIDIDEDGHVFADGGFIGTVATEGRTKTGRRNSGHYVWEGRPADSDHFILTGPTACECAAQMFYRGANRRDD